MIEATLQEKIKKIASRYPSPMSAMIPAIYALQENSGGFVSREQVEELAGLLNVSQANAYGVLTYYTMFNKKPVGKYHLQVDTNIPAKLSGADSILAHLEKKLGIKDGQTTSDGLFTISTVEDLASCGSVPVIQANDLYYTQMTNQKVDKLIDSLKKGIMPDSPDDEHFHTECNVLLKRRGIKNSTSIDTYLSDSGYKSLDKILSMTPDQVRETVKNSGLRGLGGAGFPAAVKWGFLPKDTGKPIYLICNADEGEPGTFKDRQIMQFDPHLVIEGMIIAAYATGTELGFIYIRGEFALIAKILEKAVIEAKKKGFLGNNIKNKGFDFDIIVHRGAGAYICGEETSLIESLEGKRGNPRVKPPYPAAKGLYGCPTVVNNVETLSCLPFIINNGPDAFKNFGREKNYGPKIYNVSGHVNKPGTFELPMGASLSRLLELAGGVKGNLKAVIPGGLSTPILTVKESENLIMDFDGCAQAGTMFGTGGVIVINDTVKIPEIALRTIRFYKHESCGQCVPCREGTYVIESLLSKIIGGKGKSGDLDIVSQLCKTIPGTTLCPMGDAFAVPVGAMVNKFRSEFETLLR